MDAEVTGQALGVGPAGAGRALQWPPVQGHVGGPAGRRRACGFLHCAQAGGAADREPRREPRHAAEAAPGRAAGRRHSERGAQGWDRGAALRLGVRAGEGPSRQPRPLSTCPARGPDGGQKGGPDRLRHPALPRKQAAAPSARALSGGTTLGAHPARPGAVPRPPHPRTSCWRSALSTPPRGSRLFPAGRKTQGRALAMRPTRPRAPPGEQQARRTLPRRCAGQEGRGGAGTVAPLGGGDSQKGTG